MSERLHDEIRDNRIKAQQEEPAGLTTDELSTPQKPVAYDVEGRPLYAAPVETVAVPDQSQHQVVHVSRAAEPLPVQVSDETKAKHDASVKAYPSLNLSQHEYIISAVRRHPIGMLGPLLATGISVTLMFILMMNYPYFVEVIGLPMGSFGLVLLMGVLLSILFLIGGYLAIWVYLNNRFFLTNESVIQELQTSVFSRREQTVSLMNIEDASFSQKGLLQTMLDYGSIRLSTEGEETTYRFDYVANPKGHIAVLNNAVECFKNGRPIEDVINNEA